MPGFSCEVSMVQGKRHTVAQGESVESVAHAAGHLWSTVWEAPENKPLRQTRKSPHVLLPGDIVFVPGVREKQLPCATNQQHRFQHKGIPSRLRVRFLVDGEPRASASYVLIVDGRNRKEGTTDGDGWLDEAVMPDARRAEVQFEVSPREDPDYDPSPFEGDGDDIVRATEPAPEKKAPPPGKIYVFELRHLDPVTEISGVQGRLKNLGYAVRSVDGELGPRTREALRAFQQDHGLDVTGEPDEATQAKLAEFGRG